jgi:predicted nucleic acid-binding protein
MRLVDTSAWIEVLAGSKVGKVFALELPNRHGWLVPTIVLLEMAKWLSRQADEGRADQVLGFAGTCVVAVLDTAIALSAAEIGVRHKLAAADAVIYATAMAFGAELLTCDRHFEALPKVRYMPKA